VDAPKHDAAPAPSEPVTQAGEQRTAEVIQFPTVSVEPATAYPPDIVVGGESVAVVDTSDLPNADDDIVEGLAMGEGAFVAAETKPEQKLGAAPEDNFRFVGAGAPAAPNADVVPAPQPQSRFETIPIPVISANAAVGAVLAAALPRPEVVEAPVRVSERAAQPVATVEPVAPVPAVVDEEVEPAPVASSNAAELVVDKGEPVAMPAPGTATSDPAIAPVAAVAEPVAVASESQAEPAPELEPVVVSLDDLADEDVALDEDAAMRAIEGNWSPRRTPTKRLVRPLAEPEGANQAVAASARAVTAARRTAEAVVAEVAETEAEVRAEAGRPDGLEGPRDGRKDDLTHIIGVLPVIETALNKLGLYHFDQLGELTNEQIGWIENHLGVPGRISRELWREQARELSAVLKPKRVAEN